MSSRNLQGDGASATRKDGLGETAKKAAQTTRYYLARIYNQKLGLILLALLLLTFGLYGLDFWSGEPRSPIAMLHLPFLQSLADVSLGVLIIAFIYEWIVRQENENKLKENLKVVIEETIPAQVSTIGSQVLRAIMSEREIMQHVLSPESADKIIQSALEIRFDDKQLAEEMYDIIKKQSQFSEKHYEYSCNAYLRNIISPKYSEDIRRKYYEIIIDIQYKTVLKRSQLRFTYLLQGENANKLNIQEQEWIWRHQSSDEFKEINEDVFAVEYVTINGETLHLHSEDFNGRQVIVAKVDELNISPSETVTISYRFKSKLQKRGHLFTFDVSHPTRGLSVLLDFSKADIRFVNVLDLFLYKGEKQVERTFRYIPSLSEPEAIEFKLNGWALPKTGVVFVWVLRAERHTKFVELLAEIEKRRAGNNV